jgi:hypothetical protein
LTLHAKQARSSNTFRHSLATRHDFDILHYSSRAKETAVHVQAMSSYGALLRSICSSSLDTLIIDTYDINRAAVCQCRNDFLEAIYPLSSLDGLLNLHRIVAPQEAFIQVNDGLYSDSIVKGIHPITLLPASIKRIEIIDSTTALNSWAEKILNVYQDNTDYRVSMLCTLEKIVLRCNGWYPTLVPNYRTERWSVDSTKRYMIPGRGGKNKDLLSTGRYGEHPGCKPYAPRKANEALVQDMRTGAKMIVDMSLDLQSQSGNQRSTMRDKRFGRSENSRPYVRGWMAD